MAQRTQILKQWLHAPEGQFPHPREEHLLPLMVAAGAAGNDSDQRVYRQPIMDIILSVYGFGITSEMAQALVR